MTASIIIFNLLRKNLHDFQVGAFIWKELFGSSL